MCDGCTGDLPWVLTDAAERIPDTAPRRSIMWPNSREFTNVRPEEVQVKHPALIESLTALSGTLVCWPRVAAGTAIASAEFYRGVVGADGISRLLIPNPGNWYVQGESDFSIGRYRILDASNCCAALFFGGVRINGTVPVAPLAAPLTMSAPTFATVGVASAAAVAALAARRFISLENTDPANTIWIAWGANAAVAGSGIPIYPKMGKSFNRPGEDMSVGAVNAIALVAGVNLAVQEGI